MKMKVRTRQVADPDKVMKIICIKKPNLIHVHCRIQDFRGAQTPKVGVLTYYFAHFLLKTARK